MSESYVAKNRLVLKGTLQLETPAIIGSGEDEFSDLDVVCDKEGIPFIPATSIAGVIREQFKSINENITNEFFGEDNNKKEPRQSRIKFYDLKPSNDNKVITRDGIQLNLKEGITEDEAKFDYQLIDRGAKFGFEVEIAYTDKEKDTVFKIAKTIESLFPPTPVNRGVRIGAKTNNGLGRCKLKDIQFYDYDFSSQKNAIAWILKKPNEPIKLNVDPFPIPQENKFSIQFTGRLESSLIIRSRSYEGGGFNADSIHIRSNGVPVLTGSSLKGAICSQAKRILRTINKEKVDEKFENTLFGYVNDEKKDQTIKGKIRVTEELFHEKVINEKQTRIKIDRFTGGTIETALFDSVPLYRDNLPPDPSERGSEYVHEQRRDSITFNIEIVDYKDEEAGLILLVLKDLWNSWIAIGGEKNVGRGRLIGERAMIEWNEEKIEFKDIMDLKPDQLEKLETFVIKLNSYLKGEKK